MAMNQAVAELEPQGLWRRFVELSAIPRCSKNETAAMDYIADLGRTHGLTALRDEIGNCLLRVPATPGYEHAPIVVLQSHVDMVCEREPDSPHDFTQDGIRLLIEGDHVTADGTTLGADNGIGVAAALAFLDDAGAIHGPLELLFTVDEETGLTGALQMKPDFFQGRLLLNFDAEEVGKFTIGSAGGCDTIMTLPVARVPRPGAEVYRIRVSGLKGGHSGGDIDKNRGNSIKVLARILFAAREAPEVGSLHLGPLIGGSKRNAIPREAEALIAVRPGTGQHLPAIAADIAQKVRAQLDRAAADLSITVTEEESDAGFCSVEDSARVIQLLQAIPSGILGMSTALVGLVETSNNLGVLRDLGNGYELVCAARSSSPEALEGLLGQLRAIARLVGAEVRHSDGYPGWKPKLDSHLLRTVDHVYRDLFKETPEFLAIHAGLECGLLMAQAPDLQIVAYGAEIKEGHSPSEWVSIASVARFWAFTKALVADLTQSPRADRS